MTVPDVGGDSRESLRARLLASGWRQGSILPSELAALVTPICQGYSSTEAEWPVTRMYVVVSQDCDVVQADFAMEPTVEVVLAKKISRQKEGYKHLRNPRVLHISIATEDGNEVSAEVRVGNRGFLPHALLLDHAPSTRSLDAETVQEIAAFISRRYIRDARPEAFDARIASARDALEELLANEAEHGIIFDLLFELDPLETEPNDDEPYVVKVFGVLKPKYDLQPRATWRQLLDGLAERIREALLPCDGILVDSVTIVGRSEITLLQRDDLRSLEIVWPRFAAEAADDEDEE